MTGKLRLNISACEKFLSYLPFINVILTIIIFVLYALADRYAIINSDAGIYLAIGNQLSLGSILYKDITFWYTPLGVYLYAIIPTVFGTEVSYESFLRFTFIFHSLSAYLLFLIARSFTPRKSVCIFISLLYLLLIYVHEGIYIILEPMCITFILLSILCSFQAEKHTLFYLLSGMMASLAFLTKQYGIVVIFPILLYIYLTYTLNHQKKKYHFLLEFGFFLIGFIFPTLIIVLGYHFIWDFTSIKLLNQWLYSDEAQSYGNRSIQKAAYSLGFYILFHAPYLIFLPIFLKKSSNLSSIRAITILICLMGFCMTLYIQQFLHYFQLIIPFSLLLGLYMVGEIKNKLNLKLALLLCWLFSSSLLLFRGIKLAKFLIENPQRRSKQFELASQINRIIPPHSEAYILSHKHQAMNYLCHFSSPTPKLVGYNHPLSITPYEISGLLTHGSPILVRQQDLLQFPVYRQNLESFKYQMIKKLPEGLLIFSKRDNLDLIYDSDSQNCH